MALTQTQLQSSANDVFYLTQEIFAYYIWMICIKPLLTKLSNPAYGQLIENAVIEAQLMYFRKLNEFFRPLNPRYTDELKSELFGYAPTGGFMSDTDITELHKRVAHPTTRQAQFGPASYEIYETSHAALSHAFPFFKYLAIHFYSPESAESKSLLAALEAFKRLWAEWSAQVEPPEKRLLSI